MSRTLKAQYEPKASRIVATTRDVDRDGEVVEPRGVTNFDSFLKTNPVILWQHEHNGAPVGKATGGKILDDRITLDVEWAPTEKGREVKALYEGGFMNSFSIGFIPKRRENKGGTPTYVEWELLEVSAVSIPANPMANILRSAEAAGLSLKTLKGSTGNRRKGLDYSDPEVMAQLMAYDAKSDFEEEYMNDYDITELETKLEKAREEKRISDNQRKQIKEDGDESVSPTLRVKTSGEYKGMNIERELERLVDLRKTRGDYSGAKNIRDEREKSEKALIWMHDLVTRADNVPQSRISKDMTSSGNAGDYLNPDQRSTLLSLARESSVALRNARVIAMTSDYMKVPKENAKVSLTYTTEATEAVETSATFTEVTLAPKDLDGYADVSMHLEMDSDQPIAALLLDQFAEAYAQNIDSAVFVGTGDPVSGVFLSYGSSEVFDTGSTAFSEVIAANMFNAVGKLPTARRRGAKWFVGREPLWQYVRQLKDESGRYILQESFDGSPTARILGYPVEELEYYSAEAASTPVAIFGNLQSFIIGDRLGSLTLFRDPYSLSTYHYVRYVFWTRVGFANAQSTEQVALVTAS